MSNLGRQFNGLIISYKGVKKNSHVVEAHDHNLEGDTRVGQFHWNSDSGVIENVEVSPSHRRMGVATSMYDFAKSLGTEKAPKHSVSRTNEGDAWANSLGEPLPANKGTE
jgi:ribosomal protein S18 acetylase RimI-like enzyme